MPRCRLTRCKLRSTTTSLAHPHRSTQLSSRALSHLLLSYLGVADTAAAAGRRAQSPRYNHAAATENHAKSASSRCRCTFLRVWFSRSCGRLLHRLPRTRGCPESAQRRGAADNLETTRGLAPSYLGAGTAGASHWRVQACVGSGGAHAPGAVVRCSAGSDGTVATCARLDADAATLLARDTSSRC